MVAFWQFLKKNMGGQNEKLGGESKKKGSEGGPRKEGWKRKCGGQKKDLGVKEKLGPTKIAQNSSECLIKPPVPIYTGTHFSTGQRGQKRKTRVKKRRPGSKKEDPGQKKGPAGSKKRGVGVKKNGSPNLYHILPAFLAATETPPSLKAHQRFPLPAAARRTHLVVVEPHGTQGGNPQRPRCANATGVIVGKQKQRRL